MFGREVLRAVTYTVAIAGSSARSMRRPRRRRHRRLSSRPPGQS